MSDRRVGQSAKATPAGPPSAVRGCTRYFANVLRMGRKGWYTMRDFANLHADGWLLRLTGRAGLAMLFAAILAFLGPFGTYRFDSIGRLGYWTLQMVAWLALSLSTAWFFGQLPGTRSRGPAQRRIIATIAASLPMIAVTGLANNRMNGWQPSPEEVVELFLSILLIGGAYTYLSDWVAGGLGEAQAVRPPRLADADIEPAPAIEYLSTEAIDTVLIDRLPAHIRDEILCLEGEDHYVRVHSRHGSAMVLMRFSDALRGISHIPGLQVHRSWWVAADAVRDMRRTGRTAQLILSNGASIPVSQRYLAHVVSSWRLWNPQ